MFFLESVVLGNARKSLLFLKTRLMIFPCISLHQDSLAPCIMLELEAVQHLRIAAAAGKIGDRLVFRPAVEGERFAASLFSQCIRRGDGV